MVKPQTMPNRHEGLIYYEVLGELSKKRNVRRYLEIGVNTGRTFSYIHSNNAIGVDPYFVLNCNITTNKNKSILFQMTSDDFFDKVDVEKELSGKIDFAFLDGMHVFEYLLRDFYNTERNCSSRSLIAIHDCLPLSAEMAHRSMEISSRLTQDTPYKRWWTGDVWKVVPILQKYRPDLKIVFVDAPPTGLVFITNLNPASTVLSDNYMAIVNEFSELPNDINSIREMYDNNNIINTKSILNEFDHSLYFKA